MKRLLAVLALVLFSANTLAADGRRPELKFVGLYDLSMPKFETASTQSLYTNRGDFGGGLLFEIPFGKVVGFEFGGMYQAYGDKIASLNYVEYWRYIHIPAVFKFHLGSVVSFGLGGFYNVSVGKAKQDLGGTVTQVDLSTQQKSDYGAIGTLGFDFKLSNKLSFIAEGRFVYGMKDLSTSSTKDTFMHIQGIGGFGWHF
jgi:hypothetical protein